MKKNIKLIVIGIVLIGLIAGYYYYLSNRNKKTTEENLSSASVDMVDNILMRNLEKDYPPTPKEVVKFYADITVAFYMGEYTDDEFPLLADKIMELYDDELIANKTHEQYINDLKNEIMTMKSEDIVVSSYATSSSTDVYEFSMNGRKCARMDIAFTLKNSAKEAGITKETIVLRKDDMGHWKILGWALAEED